MAYPFKCVIRNHTSMNSKNTSPRATMLNIVYVNTNLLQVTSNCEKLHNTINIRTKLNMSKTKFFLVSFNPLPDPNR